MLRVSRRAVGAFGFGAILNFSGHWKAIANQHARPFRVRRGSFLKRLQSTLWCVGGSCYHAANLALERLVSLSIRRLLVLLSLSWAGAAFPCEKPGPPLRVDSGKRILFVGGGAPVQAGCADLLMAGPTIDWVKGAGDELTKALAAVPETLVVLDPKLFRATHKLVRERNALDKTLVLLQDQKAQTAPKIELGNPVKRVIVVNALPTTETEFRTVFARRPEAGELESLVEQSVDIERMAAERKWKVVPRTREGILGAFAVAAKGDMIVSVGHAEAGRLYLPKEESVPFKALETDAHTVLLSCSSLADIDSNAPLFGKLEVRTTTAISSRWAVGVLRAMSEVVVGHETERPTLRQTMLRIQVGDFPASDDAPSGAKLPTAVIRVAEARVLVVNHGNEAVLAAMPPPENLGVLLAEKRSTKGDR